MKQLLTPAVYDSWDSFEGVTHAPKTVQLGRDKTGFAGSVRNGGQRVLLWFGERIAGFCLAAGLALFADAIADWVGKTLLGYRISPINGVPIAIILGVLLCNAVGVPALFQEGLRLCMRPLQRLAIALLGLRLSLGAVGGIGLHALPVVVLTVVTALVVVPWMGARVGLTRRLAALIAVGTSICGVSAIMATAPAIDADESEVSYAVACVAIFGMLAMLAYPFIVPWLLGNDLTGIGIFFGTAIHDTAQVTGAALAFQQTHNAPEVLNTATVVKIMRNLSMAAVIPIMAALFHRRQGAGNATGRVRHQIIPFFVLGFLGMTVARTVGDASGRAFGLLDRPLWIQFLGAMDHASTWFLTVVMAAVGLSTDFASLRRLGLRPFFVGLSAAIIVGVVGFGAIRLLSSLHG